MKKLLPLLYVFLAISSEAQTVQFCQVNNFSGEIVHCFQNLIMCKTAIEGSGNVFSCIAVQK